jgi:hypothetical protein
MCVVSKKEDKTALEILQWCEQQEEKTKKTIDLLLDTQDISNKRVKKVLTIVLKILTNVDELKQLTQDIIIK